MSDKIAFDYRALSTRRREASPWKVARQGGAAADHLNGDLLEVGMHWTPGSGGADRYFHGLISSFQSTGVPLRAVAFDGEHLELTKHMKFRSLGSKHLGYVEKMRRLRASAHGFERECLSKKIIATHFAFYALPMLAQLRRNRHIVHFHGPWADETRDQGGRPHIVLAKRSIERIVYSTANSFITLSQAFKQLLIKRFAVTPDRIAVIPGGIDTDRFNIATTQAAARDRLGWPRDRQIIVCVRRLIARKGLEELIAAIKEVKQSIPNALFLIAGSEGSQSALRVKIAEAQLSGCAEVLGFVPDDDLALVYRAADLSIVPSQKLEGFGLVTIESLAAGTPVLVTPVDGLPEAVGGLSKRLVLGGSSASHLAAGLIDALRGTTPLPGQRECHDYVRNNFDWSVIAPRILNAYRPAE